MADRKPEARKVRAMSRQVMVAVPAWVLKRLGVRPGAEVYWHRHRTGEVVLAAKIERGAGQPGRADLEAELAHVIAERDALKRALTGHDLAERREVFASGFSHALKHTIPLDVQLAQLRAQVQELLNYQRARRAHGPSRRQPPPAPGMHPDDQPPPPSPSDPSSGGAVASGAASPQATHA